MKYLLFSLLLSTLLFPACHNSNRQVETDSLRMRSLVPESPVLSPQESMKQMQVKDFTVQLVAAEPLVNSPVAINFDSKGRIWVVEMESYMPDTVGTGEDSKTGTVAILTDTNGDGLYDKRTVFLDSLVLPRAICLFEDGILVAEPPNLWYYSIKNDRPYHKILVDSTYATGGNVEHQPNGLLRAMDNWIYSAKSDKRYRRAGNKWLVEKTHFRGQWGISQDESGRLFYNTNSENLLGDYFSPGLGSSNPHQNQVAGYVKNIVPDNRVYPIRPTPGVNRGYMQDVLDDSLHLVNFTAACSPLIYGSTLLGAAYYQNAFVAEPAANLIKRNIVNFNVPVKGRQAYENTEFLASKDERFRPVSLYEGPEGALYIVDMYRGIIQHKTYLTPYLKSEIQSRDLTKPINCGRIYRVVPKGFQQPPVAMPSAPDSLLILLQSKSSYLRNKAQQIIIDKQYNQLTGALKSNLQNTSLPQLVIQSLWTLEGLHALTAQEVLPLLNNNSFKVQAISVLPAVLNQANSNDFFASLNQIVEQQDTVAAPYVSFVLPYLKKWSPSKTAALQSKLLKAFPKNVYVIDGVIGNLYNREKIFYKEINGGADTSSVLYKRFQLVFESMARSSSQEQLKALAKTYPAGAAMFQSVCQPCHGGDGNGIRSLGPPLNNSNWVNGNKNRLMAIVLYGLTGPIKVGDKLYQAPETAGEMPAIGQSKEYSSNDIAQVLSYIRAAWSNKAGPVNAKEVDAMKRQFAGRMQLFTPAELNEVK